MTAPTFDQITAQWTDDQNIVNALEVFGSGTFDALDIAAQASLNTDFGAAISTVREQNRAALASPLTQASLRAWQDVHLRQIARVIDSPETDSQAIWRDLFDHMIDNSLSVNAREMTLGAVSAVTGTGTGTIVRITVDEQGEIMEGVHADTFLATCVQDARQLGVDHEEVFEITGTERAQDELKRTGTGIIERVRCISERDSERSVQNPGFELFTGTTPTPASETTATTTTQFTGWTLTTAADAAASVDVLYRTPPGSSVSQSIRFTANNTITQDLVAVNGTRIDPNVPYLVTFHIFREASCDGTLTLTLGGTSRAVTMSTLSNAAWNVVHLVATAGQGNWPQQFNANSLSLSAALASRTTGTLYIDSILFAPFARYGGGGSNRGRGGMGHYIAPIGGATPFVRDDTLTWTDSNNTRGKNQYLNALGGLGYLPSATAAAETWVD